MFKKWLISYGLKLLIKNVSPFFRDQLVKFILEYEKKALKSQGKLDDYVVKILKNLLGIS